MTIVTSVTTEEVTKVKNNLSVRSDLQKVATIVTSVTNKKYTWVTSVILLSLRPKY